MARAKAYCIELETDVSLREAHEKYFEQPEGERKKFRFMCGDPKCRAVARAKVVGAVYHRADAFDEAAIASGRHRAPYFRSHVHFPHIDDCTWHEQAPEGTDSDEPENTDSTVNRVELGLIWLPEPAKKRERKDTGKDGDAGELDDEDDDGDEEPDAKPQRPDSTRFLATVAMNYVSMTVEQRKAMPLRIGRKGGERTFHDTCLPIFSFHPTFQDARIYHGVASIAELDNVFILTFAGRSKFAPSGNRNARDTVAKVKFVKRTIDADDRQLAEILKKAASERQRVHCFIYAVDPPTVDVHGSERRGWFTPAERDHIFIAPISMVTAKEEAEAG